ncbi:hypothetical protein Droror1_Dr00013465 [Drosera rotundifolia]
MRSLNWKRDRNVAAFVADAGGGGEGRQRMGGVNLERETEWVSNLRKLFVFRVLVFSCFLRVLTASIVDKGKGRENMESNGSHNYISYVQVLNVNRFQKLSNDDDEGILHSEVK